MSSPWQPVADNSEGGKCFGHHSKSSQSTSFSTGNSAVPATLLPPIDSLAQKTVQWTANAPNLPIADVGLELHCPRIFVPHWFLNVPQVHTVFQQVHGKRMAQGVNGRIFTSAHPAQLAMSEALHKGQQAFPFCGSNAAVGFCR